jgi:hypothetical protein
MAALVIAFGSPAVAATHVVVEKNVTLTRSFPDLADCQAYGYSFTYSENYTVTRSVTDYYDDGTLLREVVHARFVGTATNDVTGGTIRVNGVRHLVFDFTNSTFTETGVLRHVTVAGEGIVLHESGRIVTSLETEELISEAGVHNLFEGHLAEYCSALAAA